MFTGQRKWFRLFCGIAFFTIPSSLSNLVVAIAAAQSNDEQMVLLRVETGQRTQAKQTPGRPAGARLSLKVDGPTTNPDQTAIDPSFGVKFFDHRRNATVRLAHTFSSRLSSTSSFGYIRSTPFFPSTNHTQPTLAFNDGLYANFNNPDGSIFGSFGNLYQMKHDVSYLRGAHSFKWGVEIRLNKDATIFGTNPNGLYAFGGGTASKYPEAARRAEYRVTRSPTE
jgi:hypothetical protein